MTYSSNIKGRENWKRKVGGAEMGVKNDKSDVEMKLPFFFYNLNTLSSHAAATTDAVGWYDTSFHISHSHPSHSSKIK